jgi:Domain of unknown function (DUF5615)
MTKLLIDECLSAELALLARERGHHEASHVVWIGKSGWKDWELKQVLLDEDWVLVTWNCKDFRGPKDALGSKGVLTDVPLHAGLVCIDGPTGMDLGLQRSLFDFVLDELTRSQILRIKSLKSPSRNQVSAYTSSDMNYQRKSNRHFETGFDECGA